MKTNRLKALVAFAAMCLFLTPFSALRAQGADCDDGTHCTPTDWFDLGPQGPFDFNGCEFSFVDVKVRMCGGVPQINFSGLTETPDFTGACDNFKDTSLMQLADLILLNAWASAGSGGTLPPGYNFDISPCTNPPSGINEVQFITTSCYIWQVCTYHTTSDAPICNPPENNPGPAPGNKVDVWTWHDCGTACCKRTYNICSDPTHGGLVVRLIDQHIIDPPGCTKNADGTWTTRKCNNGCS